jgi:Ser/Thr protein kinase RdoA (MazF antagonist)
MFATMTSFVDGVVKGFKETPTTYMAYIAGVSAAQLHLESKRNLLPIAVKRPHKRQDYVRKMQNHIKKGIEIGSLTAAQYEMVSKCCDILVDCMNQLDKNAENNIGLVHTDIQNSNIVYTKNHGTLIDFSRCVYSYYLYDLAEMCLHADFGGSNPDLQNAILRGYHSIKPLCKDDFYAMQVLFVMFILTLMTLFIKDKGSAWLDGVLKWFTNDVHPCLVSGKGYMNVEAFNL